MFLAAVQGESLMVLRTPHTRVEDARMGSWREQGCWALVLGMGWS